MENLESQIAKVEDEIKQVVAEIEEVVEKRGLSTNKQELARLQKNEDRLRIKEEQLRDEKKQLRKKEEQLRDEKLLLLQMQMQQREPVKRSFQEFEEGRISLIAEPSTSSKQLRVSVEKGFNWKPEEILEYDIYSSTMFFVNRDLAVIQLADVFREKCSKCLNGGGIDDTIPLIDNVFGLGKTTFTKHFIRRCRELFNPPTSNYERTLIKCRTVYVKFQGGELARGGNMKQIVIDLLFGALEDMFEIPPQLLYDAELKNLTLSLIFKPIVSKVGPLFIVFDEVGRAFSRNGLSLSDSRKLFFEFTVQVLLPLLDTKDVFPIACGRGDFLSYVGERPDGKSDLSGSPCCFERISLKLLDKEHIAECLSNTMYKDVPLIEYLKCGDPTRLAQVSKKLFEFTNGHPRSIVLYLKEYCRCNDTSEIDIVEFMSTNLPPNPIEGKKDFVERLWQRRKAIKELIDSMEQEETFNLTEEYTDEGQKKIKYDIIANDALIAWDNTITKAKLHPHPAVRTILLNFFRPFKEYVANLRKINGVSIDYPNAFEWICLKKMQELFPQPRIAKTVSRFFDTPLFGNRSIVCSDKVISLPKITTRSSNQSVNINSATCHPDRWNKLLPQIDSLECAVLKPLPQSASPDGLICCPERTTVGAPSKNFKSAAFTEKMLHDECRKFNRMFIGNDCNRFNVLLIFCTNYNPTLSSNFKDKPYFVVPRGSVPEENSNNINEIVLLNLATKELRTEFFGEDIESLIEKVQVEYESYE